jgi:radical SAM protein with 4Fe4S-binding SPASM domain
LVRENERLGGKLQVRINNVLSRRNLDELPDLIRLGGELGVTDVLPMPVDGKRGARPSVEQIEWFNAEIAPRVAEVRRQFGMPLDADRIYPFGRTLRELALASEGKYGRGYYEHSLCYAPYLHAFVSHTGDVFACCMTRERMPSLGNVQQQSLVEIFRGEKYRAFRQQMKVKRLSVCGNCDQYLRENRLVEQGLAERRQPLLAIAPIQPTQQEVVACPT